MDWNAAWSDDPAALSAGPSTLSRLRVVMPLLRAYGKPGGSLLDVGCGTGLLLAKAQSLGRFRRLVGVDISELPLEQAKRACPSAELSVFDICSGALSERFDLVTSMMTLDLVPDEDAAARHIAEMLAPGGHLVVVVQHREDYRSQLDDHYEVRRHDRASLTQRFERHGLEPVRLFSWGFPLYSLYYRLLDRSGQGVAGKSQVSSLVQRLAALALPRVFMLDDWFTFADRGRVLFGVFRKARAAA